MNMKSLRRVQAQVSSALPVSRHTANQQLRSVKTDDMSDHHYASRPLGGYLRSPSVQAFQRLQIIKRDWPKSKAGKVLLSMWASRLAMYIVRRWGAPRVDLFSH